MTNFFDHSAKLSQQEGNNFSVKNINSQKEIDFPKDPNPQVTSSHTPRYINHGDFWEKDAVSQKDRAVILCAGDLMCEPAMSEAVYFDGKYCFESCFKYIKPALEDSDFAIANLETMVYEGAPYAHNTHKVNGRYHCNAPAEYLESLRYAGFDSLALANNHNTDVGVCGLIKTLEHIDSCHFMRTGIFASNEEPRFLLVTVNNIRLGIFSYTMHINSNIDRLYFSTEEQSVHLNRFNQTIVAQDVKKAREKGAEFLICYIHFIGKEYSHEITASQTETAVFLANAGMDCIMGTHTHAIQRYDTIQTQDKRTVPVIYSLGNFITSDSTSMVTRTSIIYKLVLERDNEKILIKSESYIPCRTIENILRSGFVVFPTQEKWRGFHSSQLLEDAQEQIHKLVGPLLPRDNDFFCNAERKYPDFIHGNAPQLTLEKICTLLGIRVPEEFKHIEADQIPYITFRYPWVKNNSIYFSAFTGIDEERFGNEAYQRGAKILFTSKQLFDAKRNKLPCIVVGNPRKCFFVLNKYLRQFYSSKVIAITGSVGKTTVKEMLYQVASTKYNAVKSNENANSHAAISDRIQHLTHDNEVYIQEAGAFSPGDVGNSGYMLNPDACLITNIGYPHIDLYGSIENILKDKLSLTDNMTRDGIAFLNFDDERLAAASVNVKVISFAVHNKKADYTAQNIIYGDGVIDFTICNGEKNIPARIHMVGEHNVINALAVFAVGCWLNIPEADIIKSLENYQSVGLRQNLCNIGGRMLYVDCYNSAPNTILGSIHSLAKMHPQNNGKKIVVFGDIPRLGKFSQEIHEETGHKLLDEDIDLYLFYGNYAKFTAQVLKDAGRKVYFTEDRTELNDWLSRFSRRDDIILFKAGHPMALAKTIDQVFGTSFHITDGDVLLENSHSISDDLYQFQWIDGVAEVRKCKKSLASIRIPHVAAQTPVVRIGNEAFQESRIKELIIPDTVYNIGFAAFYNCVDLKTVQFSANLKVIERSAFNGCISLTQLKLPDSLEEIGERAFFNCTALRQVFIPKSVGHISHDAFAGCTDIEILCLNDSYSQKYAQEHQISFKTIQ